MRKTGRLQVSQVDAMTLDKLRIAGLQRCGKRHRSE